MKEKRENRHTVWTNDEEDQRIKEAAKLLGLSPATFLRQAGLEKALQLPTDK